MAELNYKNLEAYISDAGKDGFLPVFLIFGEEYLAKTAFESLLDALVPKTKRSFGYEPADEDTESMADIIERLNTFAMMSGPKVVSLCDSKIFHSKQDLSALLKKCKSAVDEDNRKKASGYLNSLLSLAGVDADDAKTDKGKDEINYADSFQDDGAWFDDLVDYLKENPIKSKGTADPVQLLADAIEKGFPKKHHLVITTELVDKRKRLFTVIKDKGLVIDCSVPQGDRKADKDAKESILKDHLDRILKPSGKRLAPDAYRYLCEMTGFDLRTFTGNLEKLITYCGDRPQITIDDAKTLLRRTKQDPIYELSGAVAERNLENALFYTKSLLDNAAFPLQILATIVNQLRRLILAKDFLMTLPQGRFRGMPDFNGFKTSMMPLVKAYDDKIKERVLERETALNQEPEDGKKTKKIKADSDLILAKNPNSPYPVFLLIGNANRYTIEELIRAHGLANEADVRLKSTGENPKLILEDLLIKILRPMEKKIS